MMANIQINVKRLILSAYVKIQKWIQHYLNPDWIYGSISTSSQRDFLKSIAMTFI